MASVPASRADDASPNNCDRRGFLNGAAAALALGTLAFKAGPALAGCIHGNSRFRGPSDSWTIFQNAEPPADAVAALAYNTYPLTDAFTWNQGAGSRAPLNSSTWNGRCWLFLWANRAAGGNDAKPNPIQSPAPAIDGVECRVEYSTVERANAATQCQVRHWLGLSDWATPWTQIAGNSVRDFVTYADLVKAPATYFTRRVRAQGTDYRVMADRPWLLSLPDGSPFTRARMMGGRTAQVPGVVLDYEVADRRSPATTTQFLTALYGDLHANGAKLFVYTDALDRGAPSGLDATNLPIIAQSACDYLTVMLWGQNPGGNVAQSYRRQIAMLRGPARDQPVPWSKLTILFELDNTTLADAQFAYDTLSGPAGQSPQSICFWRNGAVQGGLCDANGNAAGVPVNHLTIAALQGSAATGKAVAATAM